jgi:hypothetical protein
MKSIAVNNKAKRKQLESNVQPILLVTIRRRRIAPFADGLLGAKHCALNLIWSMLSSLL